MHIHDDKVKKLEEIANNIRKDIIDMLEDAGSGHTAGPLDMADIFSALYFHILNHNPKNPTWEDRDRLILSNGHIVPVRYVAMAHADYFPKKELRTLRKFGSRLQGHPELTALPGIENTAGPLGDGLGQAIGIAYSARMDKKKFRTYCITGDGELDCGLIWEGAMFAGKNKLSNLTVIVDRNNIQIDGMTENVMPLEPLKDKWTSFGWYVIEVDGHNIEEFIDATEKAKAIYEKPTVILAHTIAGKGVREIEFKYEWHGKTPNKEEERTFLEELRTLGGKIKSEHQ